MTSGGVPTVSVGDVPEPSSTAILLDVREDDEWAHGHAPGAVHIPLADVPARMGELDPAADLYVVCKAGGRSAQAVRYLLHSGVEATNVDGGMVSWQQAGRPLTTDDGRPASIY